MAPSLENDICPFIVHHVFLHALLTGLLVGRGKKSKFAEKTADFAGISREFSRPVLLKIDS